VRNRRAPHHQCLREARREVGATFLRSSKRGIATAQLDLTPDPPVANDKDASEPVTEAIGQLALASGGVGIVLRRKLLI